MREVYQESLNVSFSLGNLGCSVGHWFIPDHTTAACKLLQAAQMLPEASGGFMLGVFFRGYPYRVECSILASILGPTIPRNS